MLNSSQNICVKPMVSPYLFQSEMSDVTPDLNVVEKSICANLVKDIATQLIESKIKNDGRVPHGEVNQHLDDAKRVCSIISRNMINTAMQLHWSGLFSEYDECRLLSNENEKEGESYDNSRPKIGRPVESSIAFKHKTEFRRVKVHNNNT